MILGLISYLFCISACAIFFVSSGRNSIPEFGQTSPFLAEFRAISSRFLAASYTVDIRLAIRRFPCGKPHFSPFFDKNSRLALERIWWLLLRFLVTNYPIVRHLFVPAVG